MDNTFGPTLQGFSNIETTQPSVVLAIALKSDGTYNGCGEFGPYTIIGQMTPSGNLDFANFNAPQGYALVAGGSVESTCSDIETQPDQKSVFVGETFDGTVGQFLVGRLTSAGTLDTTSFASPTGFTSIDFPTVDSSPDFAVAISTKIQPADGFILAAGHSKLQASPFALQLAIARLDTTGVLDVGFGVNGVQTLAMGDTVASIGMALQSDGEIMIGGAITTSGLPLIGLALADNRRGFGHDLWIGCRFHSIFGHPINYERCGNGYPKNRCQCG